MKNVDYSELKKSQKFTPALYHEKDGIWEGGSISQFSPVMTFKLGKSFLIAVWKYLKVWKLMESGLLATMILLSINGYRL